MVPSLSLATGTTNVPCASLTCSPITTARYFSSSSDNPGKLEDHNILKDAVRELSQGESIPMSYSPISSMLEWNAQPLDSLDVEQLEELGRAYFEGIDGLEINLPRAVEIWTEGAVRGSIESKYSRAVCVREGLGTEKDPAIAFNEMIALAENDNYNLAHVRTLNVIYIFIF